MWKSFIRGSMPYEKKYFGTFFDMCSICMYMRNSTFVCMVKTESVVYFFFFKKKFLPHFINGTIFALKFSHKNHLILCNSLTKSGRVTTNLPANHNRGIFKKSFVIGWKDNSSNARAKIQKYVCSFFDANIISKLTDL